MSDEARRAIEAVLMAATEPVEPQLLAQLVERPVAEVEGLCALLAAECAGRGFVLARVAGGYRFQTHPDLAPYVERYLLEGRHARLSSAALETLAVIAYKQPVTRSQLSAVRGVDVDGVVRSLLERGYITELGREEGPGHPVRYGTTRLFLERLGLDSLDKLPPLADLVPGAATVEDLEMIRADLCLLGVGGLHPELGVTTDSLEEAHVKRAMVEASADVIALATADKLRTAAPWVVAPLSDVTHLVTDAGPDLTGEYADAGVSVVRA
jgi:segregation and condensation protein B